MQTTASFITTPSTIFTFRINSSPITCSLNDKTFPRTPHRSNPIMQTANYSPNDELDDEDDDATMGIPHEAAATHGIRTPPLTPSERIYLDGAKDNNEYLARIKEIARRKDLQHSAQPIQTPDEYVQSLSPTNQSTPQGEYGGPRMNAADEYMENLGRMYRKGQGIQDTPLPDNRRTDTAPAGPILDPSLVANPTDSEAQLQDKMRAIEAEIEHVSHTLKQSQQGTVSQHVMDKLNEIAHIQDSSAAEEQNHQDDITLEEGARQIAELQKQIREAAGLDQDSQPQTLETSTELYAQPQVDLRPQSHPESDIEPSGPSESLRQSHVAQDPGTVDKQIQFLESYLSKLQKEAAEDPEATQQENVPEEPKSDLSEDVQTTISTVADQISKMPNERTSFQGLENASGEMSADEKMAVFEQLRRRAATAQPSSEFADPFNVTLPEQKSGTETDDGDEPSPESEAEYDSFGNSFGDKSLLIEEIETEIKAYSRDLKSLLQKHETRLQVLLSRLRML